MKIFCMEMRRFYIQMLRFYDIMSTEHLKRGHDGPINHSAQAEVTTPARSAHRRCGKIKTDEPRTLDFSGVRGFLVTNVYIVQRSAA